MQGAIMQAEHFLYLCVKNNIGAQVKDLSTVEVL